MKKLWKILIPVLAVLVLCAGVWVYYERPIVLADVLPEENWTEIIGYKFYDRPGHPYKEIGNLAPEQLLDALARTTVTRGGAFRGISQNYYQLDLCRDDGPSTLIYVLEDGRVSIAIDHDTEHYQYFEDSGTLYLELEALTAD